MASGNEIERKFLITGDAWRRAPFRTLRQGYLSTDKQRSVRVRTDGERAFLTIKGATVGASRSEFEYEIPVAEADELLAGLCLRPVIHKRRHEVEHAGHTWEVDEFLDENRGLVVGEIELESEHEPFERPAWVGGEVTHEPRYFNANLVEHPFCDW